MGGGGVWQKRTGLVEENKWRLHSLPPGVDFCRVKQVDPALVGDSHQLLGHLTHMHTHRQMHRRRITPIDLHVTLNCSQIAPRRGGAEETCWGGSSSPPWSSGGENLFSSVMLYGSRSVQAACWLCWFTARYVSCASLTYFLCARLVSEQYAFPSVTSASAFVFGGEFCFVWSVHPVASSLIRQWWRVMNCGDFTTQLQYLTNKLEIHSCRRLATICTHPITPMRARNWVVKLSWTLLSRICRRGEKKKKKAIG